MRTIRKEEYRIDFKSEDGTKMSFQADDNGIDVSFSSDEIPPFLCNEMRQEDETKRVRFTCRGKEKKVFIDQTIEAAIGEAIMDIDISDIASAFDQIKNGYFYSVKTSKDTYETDIEKLKMAVGKGHIVLCRLEGDLNSLDFNTISEKILGDTDEDVLLNWSDDSDYEETQVRISVWSKI